METPVAKRRSAKTKIYGTLLLGRSEFTLEVERIQEVVNYPDRVTAVPLAPAFMRGIFNLRGTIIPIIDMRILLECEPSGDSPGAEKVAIVDFGGAKLGLTFDATGEILRVDEDQGSRFEYTEGTDRRPVRGAFKLEDGNRIVQVLDLDTLVRIENLPQILDRIGSPESRRARESTARGTRRQCISFRAGAARLSFGIESTREIILVPELQPSMIGDRNCLGIANLRGSTLPVLDFVQFLGYRKAPRVPTESERIMIVRIGEARIGLLIDSVENILTYFSDEMLPIPLLRQERSELFDGFVSKEGERETIVLRFDGVAAAPEIRALAEGHHRLFEANSAAAEKEKKTRASGKKRVCIAFRLERNFALPIQEIREIIEPSADTITPPGLPEYVRGVRNLRGEAIMIVDLRAFYGLPALEETNATKVLVVQRDGAKFGLIVDSVDDIVSYFEGDAVNVPTTLLRHADDSFQNEVREILEIPATANAAKKTLMVIDLERIFSKISRPAELRAG